VKQERCARPFVWLAQELLAMDILPNTNWTNINRLAGIPMSGRKKRIALGTGLGLTALALLTGGMVQAMPDWPARMSGLRIDGLTGYAVVDNSGLPVGAVIEAQTDDRGRTRYVFIMLEDGRETRVASFQAYVNPRDRQVMLELPRDVVLLRADRETPMPETQMAAASPPA
jgi:hypothetical protein